MQRVYADACVVINAFKGAEFSVRNRCQNLLGDPNIEVLFSDLHRVELLPKPKRNNDKLELEFMETFLANAKCVELQMRPAIQQAVELASHFGVKPFDALHLAAAIIGKADRFVTTESPASPILRVRVEGINVETLST